VKQVKIDLVVDYGELDEKGKPWKNLKITVCLQDLPFDFRIKILNKISRDFYALFTEIPTYYNV